MSHFSKLNLPTFNNLYKLTNDMIEKKIISWGTQNQICLNTVPEEPDNFYLGSGSLDYDWNNKNNITTNNGDTEFVIPPKKSLYDEKDFSTLCTQFKNTLFEDIYDVLSERYKLGRVRLMKMEPKTCLSWHIDHTPRIHLPIKTQEGCLMIIENEVFHLEENTWWLTDTTKKHTAINSSKKSRIHLVAVIYEK